MWVSNQRAARRHDKLSVQEIEQLEALGFEWDPHEGAWEEMFSELERYRDEHGDCLVPGKWPQNPPLGTWVGKQRSAKKRGSLAKERVERLEALGFEWVAR
jgi:hypothetical protein